jgi:hypothetical protein
MFRFNSHHWFSMCYKAHGMILACHIGKNSEAVQSENNTIFGEDFHQKTMLHNSTHNWKDMTIKLWNPYGIYQLRKGI